MTNMEFLQSASMENLAKFLNERFYCKHDGICNSDKECTECLEQWLMDSTERVCKNCKWHDDFTAACCNGDSDERGEFTDNVFSCRHFERFVLAF